MFPPLDQRLHFIIALVIVLIVSYPFGIVNGICAAMLFELGKIAFYDIPRAHLAGGRLDWEEKFQDTIAQLFGAVTGALIISFISIAHAEPIPNHVFKIDGACSVGFSPKGGIEGTLVKYIGSATQSVHVMAYGFTSLPIARALIAAKLRGVEVQVVLDRSNLTAPASKLMLIKTSGIPVWVDSTHPVSHDKVIIVDGNRIETGSYNYSNNAEAANGENSMICPSVEGAVLYESHFKFHQTHSIRQ